MNDTEAERIAAAINIARPDWPASSLLSFIRKHLMTRPRRDVFVAFAWVASESETKTPARILEPGPWWRAASVENPTPGAKRGPICHHCGLEERECVRRFQDDHEFEGPDAWMRRRRTPEEIAKTTEWIRSGLGDAKAAREAVTKPKPEPLPQVARLRELVPHDDKPEPAPLTTPADRLVERADTSTEAS